MFYYYYRSWTHKITYTCHKVSCGGAKHLCFIETDNPSLYALISVYDHISDSRVPRPNRFSMRQIIWRSRVWWKWLAQKGKESASPQVMHPYIDKQGLVMPVNARGLSSSLVHRFYPSFSPSSLLYPYSWLPETKLWNLNQWLGLWRSLIRKSVTRRILY